MPIPLYFVATAIVLVLAAAADARLPPRFPETVEWRLQTAAPATSKEIAVTLKLPAEVTDLEHNARVYFGHDQTVRTRVAKPGLTVRKTGPDLAQQHDILVVGLDVTNSGGVDLS